MVVRSVLVALLLIVGVYAGYALAAGYVGWLPSPANLVAGFAVLAAALAASRQALHSYRPS